MAGGGAFLWRTLVPLAAATPPAAAVVVLAAVVVVVCPPCGRTAGAASASRPPRSPTPHRASRRRWYGSRCCRRRPWTMYRLRSRWWTLAAPRWRRSRHARQATSRPPTRSPRAQAAPPPGRPGPRQRPQPSPARWSLGAAVRRWRGPYPSQRTWARALLARRRLRPPAARHGRRAGRVLLSSEPVECHRLRRRRPPTVVQHRSQRRRRRPWRRLGPER